MEKMEGPPSGNSNSLFCFFHYLRQIFKNLFTSRKIHLESEEELKQLIDDGEKHGVIEEDEHEMLHSILEFGDTIVREVMVPRIEMSCLRDDVTFDKVLEFVIKDGHSRIPVYKERIDNLIGILYVKDLLRLHDMNKKDFDITKIMRSAFFIPETKKIAELLREFQRRKVHLAIVIDEYGGTAVLVTIEDLLEELVGEIEDEYDIGKQKMLVVDQNTIIADGRLEIDELEDYYKISLKGDDYETVGGLIFTLIERVPQQGEHIDYKGLRFFIEKVDERRIYRVKIQKIENLSQESISSSFQGENAD